jgi:hypothetical protein
MKNTPRSGQIHDVDPLAWGLFYHLDSGLRRNDVVFSNGMDAHYPKRHQSAKVVEQ